MTVKRINELFLDAITIAVERRRGMTISDKMVQYVAEFLFLSNNTGARWHDFRDVGMDEPYYEYYYAEDELYFIRDRVYQTFWATRARSPKEAFEKFRSIHQDLACWTMCGEKGEEE